MRLRGSYPSFILVVNVMLAVCGSSICVAETTRWSDCSVLGEDSELARGSAIGTFGQSGRPCAFGTKRPGLLAVEVWADPRSGSRSEQSAPWLDVGVEGSDSLTFLDRGFGRWLGIITKPGRIDVRAGFVSGEDSALQLGWRFVPFCSESRAWSELTKNDPNNDGEETEESDNEIVPSASIGVQCLPGLGMLASKPPRLSANEEHEAWEAGSETEIGLFAGNEHPLLDIFCGDARHIWICSRQLVRDETFVGRLSERGSPSPERFSFVLERASQLEIRGVGDREIYGRLSDAYGHVLLAGHSIGGDLVLEADLAPGKYSLQLGSPRFEPTNYEVGFRARPLGPVADESMLD